MLKNNNQQKYTKARQYLTAQQYLETEYPPFIQKNILKLDISNLDLKGKLDLSNFTKLEELNCANNLLTCLDLRNCVNLKKLNGDGNNNLKIQWNKKIDNQVRYSTLGMQKPLTREEIKATRIKKQRQQGGFIPNSVMWSSIHSNFDFETSQSWKNLGFTYEEVSEWIKAGLQPQDLELGVWLRDVKKLGAEEVSGRFEVKELKQEFKHWQQKRITAKIEVKYNN